jgi:hypothetical protein
MLFTLAFAACGLLARVVPRNDEGERLGRIRHGAISVESAAPAVYFRDVSLCV